MKAITDGVVVTCPPCFVCGQQSQMRVSAAAYAAHQAGALAQTTYPDMDPAQREQLISGTHPVCWDRLFADDDE